MIRLVLALLAWFTATAFACAADDPRRPAPPIITHAFIQQTQAGQRTAIASFRMRNPTSQDDRLLMVWFSASHEAHIVRVRGLSIINKGVALPAGQTRRFTPTTQAVLLTRLKQSVIPEDAPYAAVLTFEKAGEVRATFAVTRNQPKSRLMRTKPIRKTTSSPITLKMPRKSPNIIYSR
jgi:copper(I)-binding protein